MEWEKIFANYVSHQKLISTLQKELPQPNNNKINNPIKNGRGFEFNIINLQGNASKNYNEMPPQTNQDGYYQKNKKNKKPAKKFPLWLSGNKPNQYL